MEVTIGGEQKTLAQFSAFKAIYALETISEVEGAWQKVLSGAAAFKTKFEAENFAEYDRAEARFEFRPMPLVKTVRRETDDEAVEIVREPILRDGEPVLGPDPLAHLTDEDWTASGNKLRQHATPNETLQWASMVPIAVREARTHVFRLVALVLTPNDDLEKWDGGDTDIATQLDVEAKRLQHKASMPELIQLLTATVRLCKDELADPFGELVQETTKILRSGDPEEAKRPEPMRLETSAPASTSDAQTSSSGSPDDSEAATRPSGSTDSPSDEPSRSAIG